MPRLPDAGNPQAPRRLRSEAVWGLPYGMAQTVQAGTLPAAQNRRTRARIRQHGY